MTSLRVVWQCLGAVGFTIPPLGVTWWDDVAEEGTDDQDRHSTPARVAAITRTAAGNGVRLAATLKEASYPS